MVDQVEKNLNFYFPLSDSFLSGWDKCILPGVEICIKLTRLINQFVSLHNNVSSKSVGNYSLQIISTSLTVHILELQSENFLSIEKALLQRAAKYDYKDVIAKTFLISEGKSTYYKDDVFDRAPIGRLVLAMVPEKTFTGDYKTNSSISKTSSWEVLNFRVRVHLWEQRQLMWAPVLSQLISQTWKLLGSITEAMASF